MNTFRSARQKNTGRHWETAAWLLISSSVVVLLVAVFGPGSYSAPVSSWLLSLVLLALCAAITLHFRFMFLVRGEQRKAAGVLEATGREFESIFDNALDAILIMDDEGICLEANPAALTLLGSARDELVGHSIRRLLAPMEDFEKACEHLLDRQDLHGEVQLICRDTSLVFVEYTAKANYLPGRHVAILRDVSLRKEAEAALRASDERFRQMADNIAEVFWMIDAATKKVLYANRAFETVTGRSLLALRANPTSYQELFHPEDRVRVLGQLKEAARSGQFDEEFRIVRPDHAIRWVWVRGFPVRDTLGEIRRLVGTVQDVTSRKSAEEQITRSLELAQSAWAEADALRKTTLALTENLSLDYVLDTLLASLLELVPCDTARVLLVETDDRLFLARERHLEPSYGRAHKSPATWKAGDQAPLAQVLFDQTIVLVRDTTEREEWKQFKGHSHFHSWLGVPLVASGQVLGLLSLGDSEANAFKQEHLHLAKSLAIPAAVAIQNARLYERAEIYGIELERQLADLDEIQQALQQAEEGRALWEEKFTKVFRSNPIAFSITTVDEGRFIDVNEAFERRYGYSREELLGRTAFDISLWDNPDERLDMLREVREHGQVRNRMTCFRTRSGELRHTIYSADMLDVEGQHCLLAVSEDVLALGRSATAAHSPLTAHH
jgi:PAS domain S-box-containing protein